MVLLVKTFNVSEPQSYIFIRILMLRLSTSYACYNDQLELDRMTLQKSLKKNTYVK